MKKDLITAVIVDDEPLGRKRISQLLEKDPDIEVVAICKNGMKAIEEILKESPNLVFLDIQMPGLNGFEVLQNLPTGQIPEIIFVTAYDEYAIKAFDVHAIDYLLKPFEQERFEIALQRAKKAIWYDESVLLSQVEQLLETVQSSDHFLSRLMVKESGKVFFIHTDQIDWIEAAGNYIRIVAGGKKYLMRETLKGIKQKLNPYIFYRIHNSVIVNVDKIKEIEAWFHGDYQVTMNNGKKFNMSRRYKELLKAFS